MGSAEILCSTVANLCDRVTTANHTSRSATMSHPARRVKLASLDATAFTDRADQAGQSLQQFLSVPAELLADTAALRVWYDRAWEWIGTLKPKPTEKSR